MGTTVNDEAESTVVIGECDEGEEPPAKEPPEDPGEDQTDRDNDGLTDCEEKKLGTDPCCADTDGDGISDGKEVEQGTDPLNPNDSC